MFMTGGTDDDDGNVFKMLSLLMDSKKSLSKVYFDPHKIIKPI